MSDDRTTLLTIRRGILIYLLEHPDAKDTVEGIRNWWLTSAPVHEADVERALEELITEGWVIVSNRALSTAVYGLDKTKMDELRQLLHA